MLPSSPTSSTGHDAIADQGHVAALAAFVRAHPRLVVLTGAGVSTWLKSTMRTCLSSRRR